MIAKGHESINNIRGSSSVSSWKWRNQEQRCLQVVITAPQHIAGGYYQTILRRRGSLKIWVSQEQMWPAVTKNSPRCVYYVPVRRREEEFKFIVTLQKYSHVWETHGATREHYFHLSIRCTHYLDYTLSEISQVKANAGGARGFLRIVTKSSPRMHTCTRCASSGAAYRLTFWYLNSGHSAELLTTIGSNTSQ